ncbi:MAG: TlpA disulfide reductase family protein [Bryobacterales bacterium]
MELRKRKDNRAMAWTALGLGACAAAIGATMATAWGPQFRQAFLEGIGNEAVTAGRDAGLAGWTGEEAPDFTITTLDGEEIHLSDLRGKRVVVGFWATWCGACIEQAPDLKRLMNETSRDELTVLGISWEDEDDLRSLSPSGTSITPSPPPKTCPSPWRRDHVSHGNLHRCRGCDPRPQGWLFRL